MEASRDAGALRALDARLHRRAEALHVFRDALEAFSPTIRATRPQTLSKPVVKVWYGLLVRGRWQLCAPLDGSQPHHPND